jgi:soluble lytic murein transglycosylase-like protein
LKKRGLVVISAALILSGASVARAKDNFRAEIPTAATPATDATAATDSPSPAEAGTTDVQQTQAGADNDAAQKLELKHGRRAAVPLPPPRPADLDTTQTAALTPDAANSAPAVDSQAQASAPEQTASLAAETDSAAEPAFTSRGRVPLPVRRPHGIDRHTHRAADAQSAEAASASEDANSADATASNVAPPTAGPQSGTTVVPQVTQPASTVPWPEPQNNADLEFPGQHHHAAGEDAALRALYALVAKHAAANGVPFSLADAVVRIESRYQAHTMHAGNYGLMQLRAETARGMGFSGSVSALLDPETNLRFGMKYLGAAYRLAGGDTCRTVMRYQSGLYATHFSAANRAYCARAQSMMAGL